MCASSCILHEALPENRGVRGGTPANDVDEGLHDPFYGAAALSVAAPSAAPIAAARVAAASVAAAAPVAATPVVPAPVRRVVAPTCLTEVGASRPALTPMA